jgi:hypothetical protein
MAAAVGVCLFLGSFLAMAATLTLPGDAGAPPGLSQVVSLTVDDATGMLGTDIVVTYDPAVVLATGVSSTGLSAPHVLTHNLSPAGTIRISLYGPAPLAGSGALITLDFTAVGPPGSRTILELESADLNEGGIPATLLDGQFCVAGTGEEVEELAAELIPASTTAVLSWAGAPYTDSYNLYRGTSPDLVGLACLAPGVIGASAVDDGAVPAPGGLFVYLVTGNRCGGESSAGQDSDGVERLIPAPCF